MGWSIGFDTNWGRDIGYGVPAVCDHLECDADIDRGLAYVCGGEPYGGPYGCGLYFCSEHLTYEPAPDRWDELPDEMEDDEFNKYSIQSVQMCERCSKKETPFEPTPDTQEWINWKLMDESWAEWRSNHPEWVAQNS